MEITATFDHQVYFTEYLSMSVKEMGRGAEITYKRSLNIPLYKNNRTSFPFSFSFSFIFHIISALSTKQQTFKMAQLILCLSTTLYKYQNIKMNWC